MTIEAKILLDSINEVGNRLTTFQLRYPRFIHPEALTHRVFSRNASSSRAIPVSRLIQDILRDPAVPIHIGANQRGMQARNELSGWRRKALLGIWHASRYAAVVAAWLADKVGAHKQIVNRLCEGHGHINVVLTATEFDNFFDLRLHPDAQPEIQALARAMRLAMDASTPAPRLWHIPYVDEDLDVSEALKVSAARCARVSYMTHDGRKSTIEEDLALAERLLESKHMSPFEHQAIAVESSTQHANLVGWIQQRHIL